MGKSVSWCPARVSGAAGGPKTLKHRKVRPRYSKIWSPIPPNPYISETAFSQRFQKVYAYPPHPPQATTCLHTEAKLVESAEKCQNPQSWQVMDVPERYGKHM